MAKRSEQEKGVSIKLVFEAFQVSETCCGYQPKCRADNYVIADWLVRPTENRRNWRFGLCFLYLRNVRAIHRITSGFIGFGSVDFPKLQTRYK